MKGNGVEKRTKHDTDCLEANRMLAPSTPAVGSGGHQPRLNAAYGVQQLVRLLQRP
jgi:hypothetical protein